MKLSKTMEYYLIHGQRKTNDIMIAKVIAMKTGKAPAIYLSVAVKPLALQLDPTLKKPLSK